MKWRVRSTTISGGLEVPGDKSIGHRALMLAALAQGRSTIRHLPGGEDVRATAACVGRLGVDLVDLGNGVVDVHGGDLRVPEADLYTANSGTTMRLLSGILAGQPFPSVLTGDASLSRRPMSRVVHPLRAMGAHIESDGFPPLAIEGGGLHGIRHRLPVASAQVKSALLLAGLFAEGMTAVEEPVPTRDHTERMLGALGVDISRANGAIEIEGGCRLTAFEMTVPGDLSSAAFLFAAACLTGGEVTVANLGVNPTRTAFLTLLERMGARVEIHGQREQMGEPVSTVTIGGRIQQPVEIGPHEVPALIDELPLVALLATQTTGTSVVRGAAELRVKETDRIAAVTQELSRLGAQIEELPDGFVIRGPTPLRGGTVESHGDHRIAMMLAVAGCIAEGETIIENAEAHLVSYPSFAEALCQLRGRIERD